jgi:hypothetical protein
MSDQQTRASVPVCPPTVLNHEINDLHEVLADLPHPDALHAGVRSLEQHVEQIR